MSHDQFLANLQSLGTNISTDLGAAFFPIQLGDTGGNFNTDPIRLAIQDSWGSANVFGGIALYDLIYQEVHYRDTPTMATIAERTFAALHGQLWSGINPQGPSPTNCHLLGDHERIVCTYANSAGLPLTATGSLTLSAWKITDNSTDYTPASVAITSGTQITLTAPVVLTGITTKVTYGSMQTAAGVVIPTD